MFKDIENAVVSAVDRNKKLEVDKKEQKCSLTIIWSYCALIYRKKKTKAT